MSEQAVVSLSDDSNEVSSPPPAEESNKIEDPKDESNVSRDVTVASTSESSGLTRDDNTGTIDIESSSDCESIEESQEITVLPQLYDKSLYLTAHSVCPVSKTSERYLNSLSPYDWKKEPNMKQLTQFNSTELQTFYTKTRPQYDIRKDIPRLWFETKFFEEVIDCTNEYIKQHKIDAPKITYKEFESFIGLILLMNNIKVDKLEYYWDEHRLSNIPSFNKYMTKDRFYFILKHISYGSTKDFANIYNLVNYFNVVSENVYKAEKNLCLVEPITLVETETARMDLHFLGTSQEVIARTFLRNSKNDSPNRKSIIYFNISFNLLENYLNKGHYVYMDPMYTSVGLAKALLERNTYSTGVFHKHYNHADTLPNLDGRKVSKYKGGLHVGVDYSVAGMRCVFITTENALEDNLESTGSNILRVYSNKSYKKSNLDNLMQDTRKKYAEFTWRSKVFVFFIQLFFRNGYCLWNVHSELHQSIYHNTIVNMLIPGIVSSRQNAHKLSQLPKLCAPQRCINCEDKTTNVCGLCRFYYCIKCFFEYHYPKLKLSQNMSNKPITIT